MRHSILLFVLFAIVVAACGNGGTSDTTPEADTLTSTTPAPTTTATETTTSSTVPATTTTSMTTTTTVSPDAGRGCEVLHEPGEYEGLGDFEGHEQRYWMVVPETYADIAPAPLYFHLASASGDHDWFLDLWRPYLSDMRGLMVIVNTTGYGGRHPDALAHLMSELADDYCIDRERVHVIGASSSFVVAERMTCEHADKIASFVAALGGSGSWQCTPARPVPLLTFTGDGIGDRSGAQSLVDRWIEYNECDAEPIVEDLGSGVRRISYTNCTADVVFYDIEGMGHVCPVHEVKGPLAAVLAEYDEVDYLEEAFAFFADHPLN